MHSIFPSTELQGNFTAISKQVFKTFQEYYRNLLNM